MERITLLKTLLSRKRLTHLLDLLVLAILFWVARYWHVRGFGLYEDDLTIIPTAVAMKLPEVLRFIFNYIVHLNGHARPLSDSFIYLFSNLGWRLGGLIGVYWIGYLVTLVNIVLFYLLVKRLASRPLALLAGVAYCVYCADTTQTFLTHSLGLQPSITLLLLGFHLYLSNRKVLAFLPVFIILFSYETPFLVFLAAPLLERTWGRRLWRRLAWHVLIMGAMLAAVYALRAGIGEGRVMELTLRQVITVPILHMLEGPLVILRTTLTRPFRFFLDANLPDGILVLFSLLILAAIFWTLENVSGFRSGDLWNLFKRRSSQPVPDELKTLGKLLIVASVMVLMAYPLTFTVDATVTAGRATRVHAAAVVGAALFTGCVCMLVLMWLKSLRLQWLGRLGLALFFALLVGYGFILQADYLKAWQYQQWLWSELLPLIPDAGAGTAIFITQDGLQDVYQIEANTWNMPRMLEQLYQFPTQDVPRVYRLSLGWRHTIVAEDGKFQVDGIAAFAPTSLYNEVDSSQVILIETRSGELERIVAPVELDGIVYPLKQVSTPVLPSLPHDTILYRLLISTP